MKRIPAMLISLIFLMGGFAQNVVLLQHQGTSTPFYGTNGFQFAYDAAINDDTIYLPGGFFPPPGNINKRIAIIGAGHHPDSSLATLTTVVTSSLYLGIDADSCFISGLRINGSIFYEYGVSINGVILSRLFLDGGIHSSSGGGFNYNGTIRECTILGEITGSRFDLFNIVNNILGYRISGLINSMLSNNIFLGGDQVGDGVRTLNYLHDCIIRNNIFYKQQYDWNESTNNQFQKNIIPNNPPVGNNTYSGNFFNTNTSNIFVSYNGSAFSYTHNFHLVNPGTYPGTDATQVGLYGSLMPWKDGSMPLNPHIQTKTIAENTNSNGQIQVQIKVAAQNN